jgi:myo-inositol 2-dehydrogenase/D-chiro-inositol 1-dehydrogenase
VKKAALKVGIIGAGRIGRIHARSLAFLIPEAQAAAIADVDAGAARAAADSLRIPQAWSDYRQILADKDIRAVAICAPTPMHSALIEEAAAAGKHIFCEKPIDFDLARIDAALAAVKKAGVKLQIGFNRRFDANFARVRRAIAEGEIGEPQLLHIVSRDPGPPPLSYVQSSGGIFMDMTIHDFDMARFQLGDFVEVQAMTSTNGLEMFEVANDHAQAIVVMRAASGALCTIVNSRSCAYGYDQRLEAFGDLGSLEAGNMTATTVRSFSAKETGAAGPVLNFFLERYMPAYKAEFAEFVTAITEDRAPSVGFADGRAALVLAEAAIESVATGKTVQITGG